MSEKEKELEQLKPTENKGTIVGELNEMKLEFFNENNGWKAVENSDGSEPNVTGVRGSLTIETEENKICELHVFQQRYTKDGKEISAYNSMKTVANTYKTKLKDGKGDIVNATISLDVNDFCDKDGNMVNAQKINLNFITRQVKDPTPKAILNLQGLIYDWRDETTKPKENEEAELTGRLLVDFVTIGYGGKYKPFKIIIPEHMAEGFKDYYSKGTTTDLTASIEVKWVGGQKKEKIKQGFGDVDAESVDVSNGRRVTEIVVYKGSVPYTEEEGLAEKALDTELLKKAKNERENVELPGIIAKWEAKKNKQKSSKGEGKKAGLGGRAQTQVKDEDVPF